MSARQKWGSRKNSNDRKRLYCIYALDFLKRELALQINTFLDICRACEDYERLFKFLELDHSFQQYYKEIPFSTLKYSVIFLCALDRKIVLTWLQTGKQMKCDLNSLLHEYQQRLLEYMCRITIQWQKLFESGLRSLSDLRSIPTEKTYSISQAERCFHIHFLLLGRLRFDWKIYEEILLGLKSCLLLK